MMKGVLFGDKHSYHDWGLILKDRPEIGPPPPKYIRIEIPGSDGMLDATTSLTGDVNYETRPITCIFTVIGNRDRWSDIYSEILNYLHGIEIKCVMDDDPGYYYIGRFEVDEWKSKQTTSTITIKGTVNPYKYEMFSSLEDWLWDPFDFETGIIREYKDLVVDGIKVLIIEGRRKPIIPTITVSNVMTLTYNDKRYLLTSGENRILDLVLKQGENKLMFKGYGTVSVDYRGGKL